MIGRGSVDLAVVITLVGSFALLVTAHVALAFGLTLRKPRWRGPLSLVVPPLAPYWGLRCGMRARGITWLAAGVLYAIARAAASF
jgi:hypothetical protein